MVERRGRTRPGRPAHALINIGYSRQGDRTTRATWSSRSTRSRERRRLSGRMPLPAPNLDDRRFQDLVDDAKRLVQQRCPAWTDHNVHDPGVTLIETFATIDRPAAVPPEPGARPRLRQVPRSDRRATLRPPTAARATVTFWLSAPLAEHVLGARRRRCRDASRRASEPVSFTTLADVEIPPVEPIELRVAPAVEGRGARQCCATSPAIPPRPRPSCASRPGAEARRPPARRAPDRLPPRACPAAPRLQDRGRRRRPGPSAAASGRPQ